MSGTKSSALFRGCTGCEDDEAAALQELISSSASSNKIEAEVQFTIINLFSGFPGQCRCAVGLFFFCFECVVNYSLSFFNIQQCPESKPIWHLCYPLFLLK